MGLHVHFYKLDFPEYIDEFKSRLDENIQITEGKDIPSDANYQVLVYPTPTRAWIEASPALKALVIPWAGIPQKTRELMLDYPDITVHNLHHNKYNTAEFGLALLLAAAKHIVPMDQALRKNDWRPRYQSPYPLLLRDQTILILGFGEIGEALARYCLGLGMKVLGVKKHPEHYDGDLDVELFGDDQLVELLPRAEILAICLPHTDETHHLIGKNEIQAMPKGGILVNIGRGPVVVQGDLFEALKSGHLRAAASDVWYNYPQNVNDRKDTPPSDYPFVELENFVLTPHIGGMADKAEQQCAEALAELLNAANRNQPIPNKVDLRSGY